MGATINIFRRKLEDVRNNLSPLPPCHLSVNCVHPPGFLCSQKSLHYSGQGPSPLLSSNPILKLRPSSLTCLNLVGTPTKSLSEGAKGCLWFIATPTAGMI